MKIGDTIYLNIDMPFGFGPEEVHVKGSKVVVLNTQDYQGAVVGELIYGEFPNSIRTWLHSQWFTEGVSK